MERLLVISSCALVIFTLSVSSESDLHGTQNGLTRDEILKKAGDYSNAQYYPSNEYKYYSAEPNSGNK